MVRMQAQLTARQLAALREIATERGVSVAALIREGVDAVIERRAKPSREELVRRALAVAGKYSSGVPDLAVNHDEYLDEGYREAKGI